MHGRHLARQLGTQSVIANDNRKVFHTCALREQIQGSSLFRSLSELPLQPSPFLGLLGSAPGSTGPVLFPGGSTHRVFVDGSVGEHQAVTRAWLRE